MPPDPSRHRVKALVHAMDLLDWIKGSGVLALFIVLISGAITVTHKLDNVDASIADNTKATTALATKLDSREATHTQILVDVAMLKATYAVCCPARVADLQPMTPAIPAKISDFTAIEQLLRTSAVLSRAAMANAPIPAMATPR